MHRVHDLGAAGDACEREATADRLPRDDEVGLDAVVVLDRPHLPGPADPRLHLVVDIQDPVLSAQLLQPRRIVRGHGDEPALPLHRLEHDAGNGRRVDVRLEQVLERGDRVVGGDAAVGVRRGDAIHLGREGPEALLVRVHLARHRHGEKRAPVKRVVEDDHAGRPVAARAIFTAFSMPSAPEFTSSERCSPRPHGESSPSRRQTSTYGS